MKLLKTYSVKWWQASILKLTLLALGIAIGVFWQDAFAPYFEELILVAAAGTLYLLLVVYKSK